MIVKVLYPNSELTLDFHLWELVESALKQGTLPPANSKDLTVIIDNNEIPRPEGLAVVSHADIWREGQSRVAEKLKECLGDE